MRAFLGSCLAAAFVLTSAGAVYGATLATAFVVITADQRIACLVSNLDTKPAKITVALLDFGGSPATLYPFSTPCPSTFAPGQTCVTRAANGVSARCTVTSSTGKIRAGVSVSVASGDALITTIAATK